jgi:hypothetical protein
MMLVVKNLLALGTDNSRKAQEVLAPNGVAWYKQNSLWQMQ